MNENSNIFGCFVSSPMSDDVGSVFRSYIWGENGICDTLKKLKHEDYGKDLILILFQFYDSPGSYLLGHLKEIENYRKKEKAIGIPIVINHENFFSKSEEERRIFLKQSVFEKLNLLAEVVKRKNLDTNIELLRSDLEKILI